MNSISLREATNLDKEFVYKVLRSASIDYVIKTWGLWDEVRQKKNFSNKYDPASVRIIRYGACEVGFVAVRYNVDEIFISELNILPEYQNRGIGSHILNNLLNKAAGEGLNVGMQVLKVNPARRLYERLGFTYCGETGTHYLMEKKAQP